MDNPVSTELEWHGDRAMLLLGNVDKLLIHKVALQTEARAKVNISTPFEHADGTMRPQIDTGAMLNSMRAVFAGQRFTRRADLPKGVTAAVINTQEYAAYQETRRAFLWPAVQQVQKEFSSIAFTVAKAFGA